MSEKTLKKEGGKPSRIVPSEVYLPFHRQFAGSIDVSSVFDTRIEAEKYAVENPTAYAGQIISFFAEDEMCAALIQKDKSLRLFVTKNM